MRVIMKERERGLCGTCKFAIIVKGTNNEAYLKCDAIYFGKEGQLDRIPFIVKECSSYRKVGTMDLNAMGAVAWVLEIDRRKGTAGFVTSEAWNKEHPKDDLLPRHGYSEFD